jgi:hypothetical protein
MDKTAADVEGKEPQSPCDNKDNNDGFEHFYHLQTLKHWSTMDTAHMGGFSYYFRNSVQVGFRLEEQVCSDSTVCAEFRVGSQVDGWYDFQKNVDRRRVYRQHESEGDPHAYHCIVTLRFVPVDEAHFAAESVVEGQYNRNLDFKPFREFSRNSISVSISHNIST